MNGMCQPSLGKCFTTGIEFTTCNAACASIGESCAAACGGSFPSNVTWVAFIQPNTCAQANNTSSSSQGEAQCSRTLDFASIGAGFMRCCCTDTK
jgi:hypothetical protein